MADSEALGVLLSKIVVDLSDMKKSLSDGRREMQSFKTMSADVGSSVKKALTFAGVAIGIYEITSALKEFAVSAAMVGARTETLAVGMELIGKNAGLSRGTLDYYVEQLKKLGITTKEAMEAVTRFVVSGLPLDKIEALADVARNQAFLVDKNTSVAFNDILTGILTNQPEVLRKYLLNIGLLSTVLKSAMKKGMTVEDIDPLTRSMLVLNATLETGKHSAGAYEASMKTVRKQITSLPRFIDEANASLWALFQPAMLAGVQELTQGFKDLKTWADANQESLKRWGQEGAVWLKWLANGIKDIGAFLISIKDLLKWLAELYIFSKIAGLVKGLGIAFAATAAEAGILAGVLSKLRLLVIGSWPTILIAVALTGVYEAYKTINRLRAEAGFMPVSGQVSGAIQEGRARDKTREGKELDIAGSDIDTEAQRRGVSSDSLAALIKDNTRLRAEGKAMKPLPEVLPEHETAEERRAKEVKEAYEKRLAESKAGGGGKDGKGAKETSDNLLAPMQALYKAQRDAALQHYQNLFDLLKTSNEKEKAELERKLADGLIDGKTYYQSLQDLQRKETDAALAMIEEKKQAQQKAYQQSLAELAADTKLSDAAKAIASQKLEVENRKSLAKLDTEARQAKLKGEKDISDELKRQVELRKEYQQKTEDLNLDTKQLLGAITEQEAKLQKLVLEWQKTRTDAIAKAGGTTAGDAYIKALDANKAAKEFDVKYGTMLSSIRSEFTSGVINIITGIRAGTLDITTALTSMFDNILTAVLKPGFDALGEALTGAVMSLLQSLSSSLGGGGGAGTSGYDYKPGGYGFMNWAAHGGVFSHGVRQAFAGGGIVTRPTLFPMANGTGIMGEDGDEAIMPLARIKGDLGVKALVPPSGDLKVIIYNNGKPAAATAKMKSGGGNRELIIMLDELNANLIDAGGKTSQALDRRYNATQSITVRG